MLLPHDGVRVHPGRIHSLAPHILHGIEHIVQNLNAQMGHADFVDVGKTHGKANPYVPLVLYHTVHLMADIALRLFDLHQNIF